MQFPYLNKFRKHHVSFRHALDGVQIAIKTQPNFKIHLFFATLAILLGLIYQISYSEWAIILFTISTGLAIELINTSIEYTVDLLTDQFNLLAKYAKDTAAGAMLIFAFFSLIIGGIIFIPKIFL